ncbi:hypothetical protein K491DRAFT_757864 [Lophiostoma macrostomum CBS 122681]|uniref:Protein kinase domain-containing protein n=1 Tax=Lophiostoma macrostomum CBS 122681 TaxID=1314788 RepID=A0A6A6TA00_9PLEO|nr:hypothetical protein K491DRAFT_757864 [Lophiostoma macrostomum CBS 122681]
MTLKEILTKELGNAKQRNRLAARGEFISEAFLHDHLTIDNIKIQLKEDIATKTHDDYERKRLAHTIRLKSRKLYAILILLDESERISTLVAAGIDDESLFGTPKPGYASSVCSLENLNKLILFEDYAQPFFEKQWVFPPSLLGNETVQFPSKQFVFPFLNVPRFLGKGGFGEVVVVDLPRGYLEALGDDNEQGESLEEGTTIAFKMIRRGQRDQNTWENVNREVQVMRARVHDNIVKLKGSFVAGLWDTQSARSESEALYLIMPKAIMDMDDWLFKRPHHGAEIWDEHARRIHIYNEAMRGLSSGLTWIHREIGGDVGYHRDIKPSNLLLFAESGHRLVWKFGDFGASNLKAADYTGTENVTATKYWAPPEYFTDKDATNGKLHGRTHDVFSMGCVFLCLATVVKSGWMSEGLARFKTLRTPVESDGSTDAHAFHRTLPVVEDWRKQLQENSSRDQDREVLALIAEMLLPRERRIHSWEVDIDLFIILNKASPEEIINHLSKVIQASRGLDTRTKHNPHKRAQGKHGHKEWGPDFLRLLEDNLWQEFSPGTTSNGFSQAASVSKPLSNIALQGQKDMCGGQNLYRKISNGFSKSDIVVLYGMGGVGKTRSAIEYALQFNDPDNKAMKRDIFRVDGSNAEAWYRSYDEIAAMINNLHATGRRKTGRDIELRKEGVKAWLEDKSHGGWFLIVDGLEMYEDTKRLGELLPSLTRGYHQVLITTRNRDIVEDLDLYDKEDACIEVDPPNTEILLRLFNDCIDKTMLKQESQEGQEREQTLMNADTKKLLETLWSPLLVEKAARHMNKHHLDIADMNELFKKEGFFLVEYFFPNYLEYVLRPLLSGPLSDHNAWSREIRTLVISAFFAPSGVNYKILAFSYSTNEPAAFLKSIGSLQSCSFVRVRKSMEGNQKICVLKGNLQRALLDWIKHAEGEEGGDWGLLLRYNKALSMTYRHYTPKKRKDRQNGWTSPILRDNDDSENRVGSLTRAYDKALPHMPHFERFLAFTREVAPLPEFKLDDDSVRAITHFSCALVDKDRHSEALRVMEFAQDHYYHFDHLQSKANDRHDLKRIRIRFWLGRQLCKVYLSRPEDGRTSEEYWDKAKDLMKSLKREAELAGDQHPAWMGHSLLHWELELDSVRVLCMSKEHLEARDLLETIRSKAGTLSENEQGNVTTTRVYEFTKWSEKREGECALSRSKRRVRLRKLFIQITREDGLLHSSESMAKPESRFQSKGLESLNKARDAFRLSEKAAQEWFPDDKELSSEIGVEIAVAETKLGKPHLVKKAIHFLERRVKETRDSYGECRRSWDLERRLNAARLKCDQHHIEAATASAGKLLKYYERKLGSDKVATRRCAMQRYEGLLLLGRRQEAEDLLREYPTAKLLQLDQVDRLWRFSYLLLFASLCGFYGLYYQRV